MPTIKYVNGEKVYEYSILEHKMFISRIRDSGIDLSDKETKSLSDCAFRLFHGTNLSEAQSKWLEGIYGRIK